MTLFLEEHPDRITVRLPSPPGMHVHCAFDVRPGQSLFGYTYNELKKLGGGRHDLPDPVESAPAQATSA